MAVLIVGGIYYYVMHGGKRDLTTEETEFAVTSKEIIDEFAKDGDVANKKYLDKAVTIKGIVSEIDGNQIILDNTVNCTFKSIDSTIEVGQTITVKGRIVGFDDLMEELKLDECFKEDK